MDRGRWLGWVSAGHSAVGTLSTAVAIRRRHAYDIPFLNGRPEHLARDSLLLGTALSPPAVILITQGVSTVRVIRGASAATGRVLGGLGTAKVVGYRDETLVRTRLRRAGFHAGETPLIVVGLGLAGTIAALHHAVA